MLIYCGNLNWYPYISDFTLFITEWLTDQNSNCYTLKFPFVLIDKLLNTICRRCSISEQCHWYWVKLFTYLCRNRTFFNELILSSFFLGIIISSPFSISLFLPISLREDNLGVAMKYSSGGFWSWVVNYD